MNFKFYIRRLTSSLVLLSLVSCSNDSSNTASIVLPNPVNSILSSDTVVAHTQIQDPIINLATSIIDSTSNYVVDPDSLMNWAEMAYPYYFPAHVVNSFQDPYVYRYYPNTGNYLGISGNEIYVMGPLSGGKLLDIGSANSFYCSVFATNCKQGEPISLFDYFTKSNVNLNPLQASILLGGISDQSVQINFLSGTDQASYYIQYGTSSHQYTNKTISFSSNPHLPSKSIINSLSPNTQYYYQLVQIDAFGNEHISAEQTFHTARPSGDTFTFTIQADSHLDENSDINQYYLTLSNIAKDQPDFHIDLGDTFMTEKYSMPLSSNAVRASDSITVNKRYLYERNNYGHITASIPLFLVNGNHDGELGWLNDGTSQNIAIWSTMARLNYFLNPTPNNFFSGDSYQNIFTGQRASWYSWTWGDALFIVLDPFWNTPTSGSSDPWAMTLGNSQYSWLSDTLSKSSARYKFVFLHNLVGGLFSAMRGGVEAAPYYEWGGLDINGANTFAIHRTSFPMPIHNLLLKNKVTAVFHGHDHLYAKQVLDGIIYQEVPQPSAINYSNYQSIASSYNYSSGTILGSSGHLRVTVSAKGVKSQYIHSWLPKDSNSVRINGQVSDQWVVDSP